MKPPRNVPQNVPRGTMTATMTLEDAESIVMAVEIGVFHGSPSEYAQALLIIAGELEKDRERSCPEKAER